MEMDTIAREDGTEITVMLPMALRSRVGGRTHVTASGATLRELIVALDAAYPGLRFNLCEETGELRQYVNVFVNGANVRYLQGLDTPLRSGAALHILQSVAGG